MDPRLFRLTVLSAALYSSFASAVGFGEIALYSRIGEPLRAEVPVVANAGEQIDTACFTLANLRNSDLPVVSSARLRLSRSGQGYRLQITGSKPIAEPIFIIGLRANCGVELQRDYVLMPQPPLMLAETESYAAAPSASVASKKKPGNFRELRAREGETLESIAEAQAPGDIAEQRRLLASMQRANPDLAADQPLAEGTTLRLPATRKPAPAESEARPEPEPRAQPVQRAEAPPPRPKKPAPPPRPPAAAPAADRVVLGAPPEETKAGEKAVAPRPNAAQMEDRMAQLEATLKALNQEVDKLNTALALTTEALAAQQRLQTAQAMQSAAETAAPAVKAAVPAPPPADRTSQNNWLELLLSAAIGGGIAAGLAQLLGRRPSRRADDELPLAVNAYRHEAAPRPPAAVTTPPAPAAAPAPAPPPAPEAAAPTPAAAVDIPLDPNPSLPGKAPALNVDFNDGNSALELAEIMLSFGRIRGAAETLSQYIEESAPDNIQPWSMLLDLYRRGDMRPEFDKLAVRMRSKFNVLIPTWEFSSTPISGLKSLEDYAHVVWRVTNSWGTQDCLDYLYELVHDNRHGTRSGFPLEVVEEIALLMRTLEEGYGLKRRSN